MIRTRTASTRLRIVSSDSFCQALVQDCLEMRATGDKQQ